MEETTMSITKWKDQSEKPTYSEANYMTFYKRQTQRRQGHPTPVLLPGISHGWRSLVGYHLWGPTESDTTERLHFHFSLSCIGEGNGNPLQCSCLENPREGGAWWAAVHGVAQSRTRLKWLSSSTQVFIWPSCNINFSYLHTLFSLSLEQKWPQSWDLVLYTLVFPWNQTSFPRVSKKYSGRHQ